MVATVSLIFAMDEGGLIGRDNALPWRLPEDLRHFRRLTLGKTVLMGRRTWNSLGKPLDGRHNWVLSRDPSFKHEGADAFTNLDTVLAAHMDGELMVIGGAELFRIALPLAQRVHLTRVHARLEGDVRFLEFDATQFHEISRDDRPADARHAYPYTFFTLERHLL